MEALKCKYYSAKDIQEILGIGKRKANEIMHMFEARGQLFRDGKTLRVRIDYFDNWIDGKDGDAAMALQRKKRRDRRTA